MRTAVAGGRMLSCGPDSSSTASLISPLNSRFNGVCCVLKVAAAAAEVAPRPEMVTVVFCWASFGNLQAQMHRPGNRSFRSSLISKWCSSAGAPMPDDY